MHAWVNHISRSENVGYILAIFFCIPTTQYWRLYYAVVLL